MKFFQQPGHTKHIIELDNECSITYTAVGSANYGKHFFEHMACDDHLHKHHVTKHNKLRNPIRTCMTKE